LDWAIKLIEKHEKFIPAVTDFKTHFIKADNINALRQELTFSMLRRYNCFAGCHICYVDKLFEKDKNKFARYIPTEVSKEIEERWLFLFDSYNYISTNDDLYYLKQSQPKLFKWYQDHSSLMYFGSITDNAFIRGYSILMNDIDNHKGIYEISFSDKWISKVDFKDILSKLKNVHARSPIVQIKFIQSEKDSMSWPSTMELKKWVEDNGIIFTLYHDMITHDTIVFHRKEQEVNFATYDGDMYTVCGEADYLQYDSFFLTLVDAINPSLEPYDVLDNNFSMTRHVSRHLHGKIDVYRRYYDKLKYSTNAYNIRYSDYYKYVFDNLQVNDNYNYIPTLSIQKYDKLYGRLVEEGWQESNLGLVDLRNNNNVVPLFQFRKQV
jgi:hypothetical protein